MRKLVLLLTVTLSLLVPGGARAHCDTLDGPVVQAARTALQSGKVNPVLAWVRPADEAEIRAAFKRAVEVRKAGKEARELADTWFFETLVRIHRAGEGAPYTGLKAAGQATEPSIAAADRAIAQGSPEAVETLLTGAVRAGHRERFDRLKTLKPPGEDVAAGRAWVEAYVTYVHWVEGVHAAAEGLKDGHETPVADPHGGAAPAHDHGGKH